MFWGDRKEVKNKNKKKLSELERLVEGCWFEKNIPKLYIEKDIVVEKNLYSLFLRDFERTHLCIIDQSYFKYLEY